MRKNETRETRELRPNSLNPPYKSWQRGKRRQDSFAPSLSYRVAMRLKSFNRLNAALDAPSKFVEALVEGERLFSIGSVWNDWLGATLVQFSRNSALS